MLVLTALAPFQGLYCPLLCPAASKMSVSSTFYGMQNVCSLLTSFSCIQAMSFSPKVPIDMFSPQKNHFPKMQHTTFLESRKCGSSFWIKWPFSVLARSIPMPASCLNWEFHEGRNLSYSPSVSSLTGACMHINLQSPGNSTYTHLSSPQCLACDSSHRGALVISVKWRWIGQVSLDMDRQRQETWARSGAGEPFLCNNNSLHLLTFYYVSGALLSAFCALTCFVF